MKAHMTQWSNIRDMRDLSLWCFCAYFSSPYERLRSLWQQGVYRTWKGPNQLRGHCFLFLVLHRVFVCPRRSLPSLIPFFLPAIASHEGLLWAPGARDHCALHNKEKKTSHVCKMGSCQLDRFSQTKRVRGEGRKKKRGSAPPDLRSHRCGLRGETSYPIRAYLVSQSPNAVDNLHQPSDARPECPSTDLKCSARSQRSSLRSLRFLGAVGDLLIIILACISSRFFPAPWHFSCLSLMGVNVLFLRQPVNTLGPRRLNRKAGSPALNSEVKQSLTAFALAFTNKSLQQIIDCKVLCK